MKNVTILTLGMLLTQLSFAQKKGEFRFGLKGVANLGWVAGTNKAINSDGAAVGFGYGLVGDYYFNAGSYGISAEFLITDIKTKFTLANSQVFRDVPNDTIIGLRYTYNLQYLELPVSVKFRTKEIGNVTYTGNFGFA